MLWHFSGCGLGTFGRILDHFGRLAVAARGHATRCAVAASGGSVRIVRIRFGHGPGSSCAFRPCGLARPRGCNASFRCGSPPKIERGPGSASRARAWFHATPLRSVRVTPLQDEGHGGAALAGFRIARAHHHQRMLGGCQVGRKREGGRAVALLGRAKS